ncbi:MAG: helix-hairpin-helix domain-containing protein [Trueperaceae bacterium]|nr:helix-hairpin-helix domain-containing protein [Trueperaceae bacterium]
MPRDAPLAALLLALTFGSVALELAPRLLAPPPLPPPERAPLQVQVAGEVHRPGPVTLSWGARVADALAAAGGPTPAAATDLLDPRRPLVDGATVRVPARGTPRGDARVSLNEASPRLLATLPGIGPALAARIVEARPFHAVDDLVRVSGIGPATLDGVREHVRP